MRGDRLLHPVLRCDTDAEYFADGPLAQLVEHLTFNQTWAFAQFRNIKQRYTGVRFSHFDSARNSTFLHLTDKKSCQELSIKLPDKSIDLAGIPNMRICNVSSRELPRDLTACAQKSCREGG